MSIAAAASEAVKFFECGHRIDVEKRTDETFVKLSEQAPGWVYDLVREVHGSNLPDDFYYENINSALLEIAQTGSNDAHEWAEGAVSCYTYDLATWAKQFSEYVDEAKREGLIGADTAYDRLLAIGQYTHLCEIYSDVYSALEDRADEIEDEEIEDDEVE